MLVDDCINLLLLITITAKTCGVLSRRPSLYPVGGMRLLVLLNVNFAALCRQGEWLVSFINLFYVYIIAFLSVFMNLFNSIM